MLSDLQALRIEDYDYPLPDERIARYPLPQRDHSKLLCLKGDNLSEHHFYDLPSLLPKDALLVFNDTRVIHARLLFRKETGAVIEIFCLEPNGMDVTEAFGKGAALACELCGRFACGAALLKERSPSCGVGRVYDGTFSGRLVPGDGVTAEKLRGRGVRLCCESELEKLL